MTDATKPKVLVAADYFIEKSKADSERDITNKKLQKLLYYSQAWSLVLKDRKMFDDDIQAWVHGPAIPLVYETFMDHKSDQSLEDVETDIEGLKSLSNDDKHVLDIVWNVYGKYGGNYLEALTHAETPWIEARGELESYESSVAVISTETMKRFYVDKLQEAEAEE